MAVSSEYRLIDTRKFEAFIRQKDTIPRQYNELKAQFDTIVSTLLDHWEGEGADAFRADSEIMRKNMEGMGEMISTLCATLSDIYELLLEADTRIGQANREAA